MIGPCAFWRGEVFSRTMIPAIIPASELDKEEAKALLEFWRGRLSKGEADCARLDAEKARAQADLEKAKDKVRQYISIATPLLPPPPGLPPPPRKGRRPRQSFDLVKSRAECVLREASSPVAASDMAKQLNLSPSSIYRALEEFKKEGKATNESGKWKWVVAA